MRKLITCLLFSVIVSAKILLVYPQDIAGGWTQMSSMTDARLFHASCLLEDCIYVMGGIGEENFLSSAEVYDISLDKWDTIANMNEVRGALGSMAWNNKVYAISGVDGSGSYTYTNIEEYNPEENKWLVKENMPEMRWAHGTCMLNDSSFYILGGTRHFAPYASCRIYYPGTDTWDTIAEMNYPREFHATCVYNNNIFVFGGSDTYDISGIHKKVEVYDPLEDKWEVKAELPVPSMSCPAIVHDDKIYLFGGGDSLGGQVKFVFEYNPVTDTWKRMQDMPFARAGMTAHKIDENHVYFIGGITGEEFRAELWKFNMDSLQEFDSSYLSVEYNSDLNTHLSLQRIYPNPIIEYVIIDYQLSAPCIVQLEIYNCLGKQIESLVNEIQYPGKYHVTWHAEEIIPGIYFCKLKGNGYTQVHKLIVSQ